MNDNSRRKSTVDVATICQPDVITVELGSLLTTAISCMSRHHVGSVLVEEKGDVRGLVTRRKAMYLILEHGDVALITADMLMPVLRVKAGLSADELGLDMISQNLAHAMVYTPEGDRLGIVSQSDLVNSQGLEHDLFMKPLRDVTNFDVARLSAHSDLRTALERLHSMNYSAMLVGNETVGWQILTETDAIRFLSADIDLNTLLADLSLPSLVSVGGDSSLFTVRSCFKDNGFRHIGVIDDAGHVVGIASYADILRSVEMDYVHRLRNLLDDKGQALRRSQHDLRLIEQVINASREGVLITDVTGRIQSVNAAFTAITGYQAWEVLGHNPNMLSSGRHEPEFYNELWHQLTQEGRWQGEIWNQRKDGSVYPEWLSITAIQNEQGDISQYAAIFHDLTEMKRSEARVQQLSWFDSITGLANRRLFEDRLQLAHSFCNEHQKMMALLALDIDLFKQINDRFGHKGGDTLLKQVAERIESTLIDRGTAARPAGDEFYVILTEVKDREALDTYLDELSRALSMPFWLEQEEVRLMVSIGIALAPEDAESGEALIRASEIALHHSKERGRNNICFFSPEQHQATLSRYRLAGLLQQALERNEFSMVYQPQICVHSGELIGVEALLRWHNPQLGDVSPELFIPVAEDAGLIDVIGRWVLERSIQEAASWAARGLQLKLAVNISARQFQRGDVADQVIAALQSHDFLPSLFVVELTETCFMHSAEATERELVCLREHGVRVAIDDFGTGYSSLSYIRNMSLDILKIDRSFISGVDEHEAGGKLVRAMIDMSHAMKLEVVAEGIESESDLTVLKQLGCDQAQGYHIGRPMPSEQLLQWTAHYHPYAGYVLSDDTPTLQAE